MGGGGKAPAVSAEEKLLQKNQAELLALQTDIIKQQQAQQKVLLPFLAEQEGFEITMDDAGNITGITKTQSELADKQKQLETELTDRSLAALRGELPVSPALERDLAKQGETLRERLSQQLGTGYETSSAGIESLGKFEESAEALREGARTNQLTLAEQLGITRQQQNDFSDQSSRDALRTSAVGDPLTFAGAFGQTAAGYGAAQQPYAAQRNLQAQMSANSSNNRAAIFGAGLGAIGSIFSDERLKKDAVVIARHHKLNIPIYCYTMDGERRIGVFAGDVEKVKPGAVFMRGGYRTVQYKDL